MTAKKTSPKSAPQAGPHRGAVVVGHPSDPALSVSLGLLSRLEDKLDRVGDQMDGVVKRLKAPNPNDPALSVVLARIEGLENRLEKIAQTLAKTEPVQKP